MILNIKRIGLALATMLAASSAVAGDFSPALVFSASGKFDKSFNEAAYNGAEQFKQQFDVDYRGAQIQNDAQKEQVLRNLARKHSDLIVATGFSFAQAVETVAREYPAVKFTLLDAVARGDNVQSVLFKQEEGSFLAGMAAQMASGTNKVGFIGGMDVPIIRSFACGYLQGARYADQAVEVVENMAGSTAQAFNDPARGTELARAQFDQGVDVIFAAAGNTGIGVMQAASDAGKLSIGVDSNQNHLYPGSVLTSMLKRVDIATFNAFKTAMDGTWQPGVQTLGLKEGGVDWVIDAHNRSLVTPDMDARVSAARDAIIAGEIKVIDYTADNSCPL
jgi:basic membrane protein A